MAGSSAIDSGMGCDVVHDERDLKQFLNLHGQRRTIRQVARARYEDVTSLVVARP